MRLACLLLACFLMVGCAAGNAFRSGRKAERVGDYDRAVLLYSRAVQHDPDNSDYRQSRERAALRASNAHAINARRMLARGLLKEALDEFRLALDLDPQAITLREEAVAVEKRIQSGQGAPTLADEKRSAATSLLPGLVLGPTAKEPISLSFHGASLREAYMALGKSVGVNFIFDPQFVDQSISLDLQDVSFDQALVALASVGHTFHRVAESKIVTVVPDNANKRREYEQQVVKTFFLSNAELKDVVDLLRVVLMARRVAPLPGANALTMTDTPDRIMAAERIIDVIDKKRAEVLVDVEILEVNRATLTSYGIEITSGLSGVAGVAGGAMPKPTIEIEEKDANGVTIRDYQGKAVTRERAATLDDPLYKPANLLVSNLPGVIYRLLKTDGSTRLLANPQLRISEGQPAEARFGDLVPVPVTVFAPVAQGGLAQQPVTSFEYKNVGVNIDITPRVHHDGEITLTLRVEISSIATNSGYQGLPAFNTRTVKSVIRLHEGETNVLAGLISDSERRSLSGLPGLSSLPILGRLFARNQVEINQTDIVMTLTPHVIRRAQITVDDLRAIPLGSESSPVVFELPTAPAPVATPVPRVEAPRIEPIRPPATPTPTP